MIFTPEEKHDMWVALRTMVALYVGAAALLVAFSWLGRAL